MSQFALRKGLPLNCTAQKKDIILKTEKIILGSFDGFTKAFDYVDHAFSLYKLDLYHIRCLASFLLRSYLELRKKYVFTNGSVYDVMPIRASAPQGSVIGPLLFDICINIIANIDQTAKFIVYADNPSILLIGYNADVLVDKNNATQQVLQKWSRNNSVKLNPIKRGSIIFSKQTRSVLVEMDIVFNSLKIEMVDNLKTHRCGFV